MHVGRFEWTPIGVAAVVTAFLVDVGLIRTGNSSRNRAGRAREITVRGQKVG
jgi:hypothetical protein